MKVKVKICGIQIYTDAKHAIQAGADFLGFIFVKDSKRFVEPAIAKEIIKKVKGNISIVGVFRNNSLEEVNYLCDMLDFDFVQLHGEENPEFCQKVIRPVIKVFGLSADFSPKEIERQMRQYTVQYYLIDREEPGVGDPLSLDRSAEIAKMFPLFFAGGLNPENVTEVVKTVKPFVIDVISGVKTGDRFDFEKMKKFVSNAKGATI